MSEAVEPHRLRGAAKRAIAPFERRIEIAVTRAVEVALRREISDLQVALRADIATLVELTYELERLVRRVDDAIGGLASAPAAAAADDDR